MHKSLQAVISSLDGLAEAVLKATSDDRTMTEIHGWNHPPLSRHDLSNLATNVSIKIDNNEINDIAEEIVIELDESKPAKDKKEKAVQEFKEIIEFSLSHPILREMNGMRKESIIYAKELPYLLSRFVDDMVELKEQ